MTTNDHLKDPAAVALGAKGGKIAGSMRTPAQLAARRRNLELANAVGHGKPTACKRCGTMCPSRREAAQHCP